jgi:flavodoxin
VKALVVYDSFFGNTEKIAREIARSLGECTQAEAVRVTDVRPEHLTGLDLLVAGSPTRAFSASPAFKAWLKSLRPGSLKGVKVAGFDTRADLSVVKSRVLPVFVNVFGYAAEPIAAELVKKGGTQAIAPGGFLVSDKEGPLNEGELERAAAWARQMCP